MKKIINIIYNIINNMINKKNILFFVLFNLYFLIYNFYNYKDLKIFFNISQLSFINNINNNNFILSIKEGKKEWKEWELWQKIDDSTFFLYMGRDKSDGAIEGLVMWENKWLNEWGLFTNNLYFFLPELFFTFCIFLLLIFGVIYTNKKNKKFNKFLNVNNILINLLLFIFFILFLLLINNYSIFMIFNGFYISNNFIYYFKCFLLIIFFLFLLIIKFYIKYNKYDFEFLIILFISIFAIFLIIGTNNFISLYLSIELLNLCLYILVSFKQNSHFSTEAGLKFFIIGSISSGLLLFGISILYGFTGLLNFDDLFLFFYFLNKSNYIYLYNIIIFSLFFILISFMIKISLSPFHMWSIDVYYGTSYIITFFLMIIPKIAYIYILIKFLFYIFLNFYIIWYYLIYFCILLSLLIGTFGALYQIKLKKILIYSMISNTGFFFIPFLIPNIESLSILLFYIFVYFFINIGLFICIFGLRDKSNNIFIKNYFNLINLFNINSILSFYFLILLFSISGLPPLLGFYSKLFLFLLCIKNKLYFIAIFGIIISVINFFYYIRLIKLIFFNKNKYWFFFDNLNKTLSILLSFIVLINILFFIYPNPILLFIFKISFYFYL